MKSADAKMLKMICIAIGGVAMSGCRVAPADGKTTRTSRSSNAQVTRARPLTISLDMSFPKQSEDGTPIKANFETVAHDVLQVVQKIFSGAKILDNRPIVCYLSSEPVPRTDCTSDPAIVWIGIVLPKESLNRLDYSRFTYQLGHELGHVLLDARRSNGLAETLADAVSYQTLDEMTKLWRVKYSAYQPWKDFAPQFGEYGEQRRKEWTSHLPRPIQDAAQHGRWAEIAFYLKKRHLDLDANPFNDEGLALRNLSAMALRSGAVEWRNFAGIAALTDPSPSQDKRYRQDLPTDLSRASVDARKALRRLGR